MAHILIVEDEKPIRDLIAANLGLVGHTSAHAADGDEAEALLRDGAFDLALVDVMLPGRDGFDLIGVFSARRVPVIYLTARASVADKVRGLDLGAEDYITKPFEAVELIARVNVALRRGEAQERRFSLGDVDVDLAGRAAYRGGQTVDLTNQEYKLLETLVENRNIALSRDQILEMTWGYDYLGEARTVDVHIQKLRSKLGWEDAIKTVYKYGYRLEAPR
jgi:DNA-binding response OmpR family regulator